MGCCQKIISAHTVQGTSGGKMGVLVGEGGRGGENRRETLLPNGFPSIKYNLIYEKLKGVSILRNVQ